MNHLRLFENFEDEPQIGDYVYCDLDRKSSTPIYVAAGIDFINNSIGQFRIFNPNYPSLSKNKYMIYYDNAPKEILPSKRVSMNLSDIVAFAPTIEELELKMKQLKFNL